MTDDAIAPEPETESIEESGHGGEADEVALAAELAQWARNLPGWQQDLVARLLASAALTEPEIEDAVSHLLSAVGFDDGRSSAAELVVEEEAFGTANEHQATEILSLGGFNGVNGLPTDLPGPLEFSREGLTLVYGKNAAGKSSYVRPLKYVGRAAAVQVEVLPDVRATGPRANPSASLSLSVGGTVETFELDLKGAPPAACSAIRTFDSRCADQYVASENKVDFTPPVLGIFDRLAASQQQMKERLATRRDEINQKRPEVDTFADGTATQAQLVALAAGTDFDAIESLATVSADEVAERDGLAQGLAATGGALDAQIVAAQARARQARGMAGQLNAINAIVGDAAVVERQALRAAAAEKSQVAEKIEHDVFGVSPRSREVADAWDPFWESAERYFHAAAGAGHSFPPDAEGDPCPLCGQELDEDARARFKKFAEFVADDTAQAARAAKQIATQAEALLTGDQPRVVSEELEALRALEPELAASVDSFLSAAAIRTDELRELDELDGRDPLEVAPTQGLEDYAVECDARVLQLIDLKDPEKRAIQQSACGELDDRIKLKERIAEFRDWFGLLPELEAIDRATSALSTQSITTKHGYFSDRVITGDFIQQLGRELTALGFSSFGVTAVPRGVAGGRMVRISLPDVVVEGVAVPDILSEGEQRALALACFFAEVVVHGGSGPIVLDDPVSSFDQDRREIVAKRLHDESMRRQVIVFSHDLAFTYYLMRIGEDRASEISLRYITRYRDRPGYVVNQGPNALRPPRTLVNELIARLDSAPDELIDGRDATVEFVTLWYTNLRRAWERTIEREMLRGVVTRFDRAVKSQSLKIVRIDSERVTLVTEAMTRASIFAHDEPIGDDVDLPTIDQMRADGVELKEFLAELKEEKKELEELAKSG